MNHTGPLAPLVHQAAADLARRLSVDPATITLVDARVQVWPDTSLGCPREGMLYQQVLRDGALIVLSVAGVSYPYHSGGGRAPFLCGPKGPA